MVDHIVLDGGEDDTPQAAAAAQKAPPWPPSGNKDLASWPPVPPWPHHKASSAEEKVKKHVADYQLLGDDQFPRKLSSFLGVLTQGTVDQDQKMSGSVFTFRENAWIQLEALRRVWAGRKGGDNRFLMARLASPLPSPLLSR